MWLRVASGAITKGIIDVQTKMYQSKGQEEETAQLTVGCRIHLLRLSSTCA